MSLLALLLAFAPGAWAGMEHYSPAALEALEAKDRLVLVQFTSPTCQVCATQELVLLRIANDPLGGMPTVLQASMERDSELRKRLNVSASSTLVLLRGRVELGRQGGLRAEEDIREFIHFSLADSRGRPKPRRKRTIQPRR